MLLFTLKAKQHSWYPKSAPWSTKVHVVLYIEYTLELYTGVVSKLRSGTFKHCPLSLISVDTCNSPRQERTRSDADRDVYKRVQCRDLRVEAKAALQVPKSLASQPPPPPPAPPAPPPPPPQRAAAPAAAKDTSRRRRRAVLRRTRDRMRRHRRARSGNVVRVGSTSGAQSRHALQLCINGNAASCLKESDGMLRMMLG